VAVIEEDDVLRSLLADILTDEGYDVLVYDRVDGVHQLIRRALPSIVLLDLHLGTEDADAGWRIVDELVLDPATRPIPMIIVSADPSLESRRGAISSQHGLWALRKPFDFTELLTIIGQAVSKRAQPVRL
jgi:CheY-like chemotaxis protein